MKKSFVSIGAFALTIAIGIGIMAQYNSQPSVDLTTLDQGRADKKCVVLNDDLIFVEQCLGSLTGANKIADACVPPNDSSLTGIDNLDQAWSKKRELEMRFWDLNCYDVRSHTARPEPWKPQ